MTLQCFYYPRSLFFVFLRIVFQSFLLERKFPVWLFWVHNNDFYENWYCRVIMLYIVNSKTLATVWFWKAGLLMNDDIGWGLPAMAICFDFRSSNVVQLSNRNSYIYLFQYHHLLITQLSFGTLYSFLDGLGKNWEDG